MTALKVLFYLQDLEMDTFSFPWTERNFEQAIQYYSEAIELNPLMAVYYGNRSFAYLKTECYGYALTDASKALELDNKYIKVNLSVCVSNPFPTLYVLVTLFPHIRTLTR